MSESPEANESAAGAVVVRRRAAGLLDRMAISLAAGLAMVLVPRVPLALRYLAARMPGGPEPVLTRLGRSLSVPSQLPLSAELPLVVACVFVLLLALGRMGVSRFRLTRPLVGLALSVVVVTSMAQGLSWVSLHPALLPVGLAGLWVAASYGPGAGLLVALSVCGLLAISGIGGPYLPALLLRAALPVLFFRDRRRASAGFWAAELAGVGAGAVVWLLSFHVRSAGVGQWTAALVALGGLVEGGLFVVTRGSGERLLGYVSRERLHGLLDLEQPLLQRMIQRAPGSFEHSRTMANLAEQAASAIGADALLIRVGAYYHDLGKSIEARHFVENLEAGECSPHEALSPVESARQIHRHVVDGVRLLRAEGIPEPVVEFAYTHHGTQLVEYFLSAQRRLCEVSGEDVDVEAFRYPGMRPNSRETAILMLVDSIEAASRTLDEPSTERFEEMVRRILFSKLASGQLDESDLSMKDLRVLCDRVVLTLVHMNHHRIKYPWQEEKSRPPRSGRSGHEPAAALAGSSPSSIGRKSA